MANSPNNLLSRRGRLLLQAGGIGALAALMLFVAGIGSAFLIPNEDVAEFILVAAPLLTPLLLVPTAGALYWIYRRSAPRLSIAVLVFGALGCSAFLVMLALYLLSDTIAAPDPALRPLLFLWYGLMVANGLWPIIAGSIEITRPTPILGRFGALGILAGGAWTVFILCALAVSSPIARTLGLDALLVVSLPILVVTQCLWMGGIGRRLLAYPRSLQTLA